MDIEPGKLRGLKRGELQKLAKTHNIKGNLKVGFFIHGWCILDNGSTACALLHRGEPILIIADL